ncbi:acyl-CoA carboxylase subunit epsilon [Streptomyces sp. NPDC007808]|uniref:acyl-CoA carboxylase subunit epsilon n=1 Tax=Streptomyces sp. NPDC007808 TaxID=3364779 RepID=UPI0036A56040
MSDPLALPEVFFRIEKGNPDAVELAALTAVLLTCGTPGPPAPVEPPRAAARWAGTVKSATHHTPRSWRTAAWPGI